MYTSQIPSPPLVESEEAGQQLAADVLKDEREYSWNNLGRFIKRVRRQLIDLIVSLLPFDVFQRNSKQRDKSMTRQKSDLLSVAATYTPPRQRSAFALIATGRDENRQYLLQWNANWHMFNLIGGKVDNAKGDNDSFQRTIAREMEEELGLRTPDECSIVRQLETIEIRQFSRREQIVKDYEFAVFEVDIFPKLPLNRERPNYFARWLSTGRENVFVSGAEIENLRTETGRPISATTRAILRELGELSAE